MRDRLLIQLTDLHLDRPGGTGRDPVDTAEPLARALRAVRDSAATPAALVFTGDLTEHGAPEEYRRLRSIVDPELAAIGVPAVFLPGNHDDRAAFREHLLGVPPDDAPVDQVVDLDGLRLIALDSTVPHRGYGELRPGQLEWLRDHLAEPAPEGTVLALHHPPLPSPAALADALRLRDPAALGEVIRGTDVRAVLAGHTHVVSTGVLTGVPVWTGGAISTTLDGLLVGGGLRGLANAGVSRVDLFGDGGVLLTHVPTDARTLTEIPASVLGPMLERMRAEYAQRRQP